MAQLSTWQDYAAHKLYLQQILIPLTVRNNIHILPGKTAVVSLTLRLNKTSFTPRHAITGKGVAYIKSLDPNLPLRPIEIEFENNHCCIEIHNTSHSTVEFLHGQEMAYFDARSKGLVQTNNLKHFPIDQYLHDRMTPATLSPSPLAYKKLIHPTEMPHITTCTELPADDTNKSTSDDKYPWLDPDDIRRNMPDKEILQMKLNLKDSVLDEKGKEEFLEKVEQFTNVFSLRDEISTCPEVHLKLKDETPFFVRPYPMREETAPEFEAAFTNVYQYYGNSLISFTNTIDDLLLQLSILIKLKVQVPVSLFSIKTVPVPLGAETYLGEKREYTQIILETKLIALTENNYISLTQAQIALCAKIGYMYYCEYAHLLKKNMEHTCMSAIYYDQGSDIKAKQCKNNHNISHYN